MAIQNSDKLLVGRGDTSYHVTFSDSGLVSKSGDTMTGDLVFADNNKVITRFLDSGENTNLTLSRFGQTRIVCASDEIAMHKVVRLIINGTQSDHVVSKGYVDDSVNTKMPRNINTLPLLST
jgi:hypothetical protein